MTRMGQAVSPEHYCELAIASNFSFLQGASHPEELVVTARKLGLAGICVCDRNTVAGVVRAHMAAREAGIRYQPGCRLTFIDSTPDCLVWPKSIKGWNNLCRMLTIGNRRAPKGECHLELADLLEWGTDLAMALIPQTILTDESHASAQASLRKLADDFPQQVRLAASPAFNASTQREIEARANLASRLTIPLLTTNNVAYHRPERRRLQDVVTCIRNHVKLVEAGQLLESNAERHLKDGTEMARLFSDYPEAIAATVDLFSQLSFSLDELQYQYPDEAPDSGLTCQEELERLALEGAAQRYPDGVPEKIHDQITHELALIAELEYAPYFLTVYDIVRFARSQDILCQGRGSAANSTVCYCIGITDVDPSLTDLLFERFISPERREPPDIDVDFEHERREEVIQYIYSRYGREHSALAATVITYRARSAAREIGKVFGLSEDVIGALSGTVWGHHSTSLGQREAAESGLDMNDPAIAQVMALATEINGFPRHLSQHAGGFVITRNRLDGIIPVMNTAMEKRTQVEWDKDDLESLGILKIDILALGMLTCLRKAFDLLESHYGQKLTLATLPKEDPRTYAMIQRADTIGVFQIESRAQMSMLPRLKPRNFYDLVIEVAIVRPGPIQGDMVHPYLRRRQGKEKVSYPSRELEDVLGRTLGVPLFQEQAMKIAIVAAGFTPGEADKLRRAMATFRRVGTIHTFQNKMVEGMAARGYERDFAERCFRQIEGFGEYGFPESHAASFALLVYASCWLKCHYPDVFCAAILNSQPMGFYSASQLVRDAREHGVEILPADINLSGHDNTLEPVAENGKPLNQRLHVRHREMARDIHATHAVRLGLRQIKGIGEREGACLLAARGKAYESVRDLWQRSGLSYGAIERLADADAFRSAGINRRTALWQVKALDRNGFDMDLFDHASSQDLIEEPVTDLPIMPQGEEVIQDYRYLSLSLKGHPASFVREAMTARKVRRNRDLEELRRGNSVSLCGLVMVRQRPGSAKGVVFMTLEDETGIANAIVWPKVMERYRSIVMGARFVIVHGQVQKADGVTHVVIRRIEDATLMLAQLCEENQINDPLLQPAEACLADMGGLANADEVKRPVMELRLRGHSATRLRKLLKQEPGLGEDYEQMVRTAQKVLPKGRNFH